ncbi:ankyrin repeats (3 copies) domain-containing protein [Ditylenchus destructor]|nr:ankyrin repeats (3 copies) domain-containing protein [Ditylenchus destructor]
MENSDPAEKLRIAADEGQLDICRNLLAQHPNIINERGPEKITAIFHACYNGHLDIVKFLVENGANIEKKCREFRWRIHRVTPLMAACMGEHMAVVEYLLSVGARVDERAKPLGSTALHDAVFEGNEQIVEILLKAGAKQQKNNVGTSPLIFASYLPRTHLFPMLMANTSAQEVWDAWKILGCTYVGEHQDLAEGLIAWRKAVSKEGVNELIANGDLKVDIDWSDAEKRRIYGGYPKEAITLQEVDNLANDVDAIHIQTFLIMERTNGDSSPTTLTYLDRYAWQSCENGRWERACDFWLYVIYNLQNSYKPMDQAPTLNVLQRPIMALKCILEENEDDLDARWRGDKASRMECRKQVKLEWLVDYFGVILSELQRYFDLKEKINRGEIEGLKIGWQYLSQPSSETCEQIRVTITELIYCIGRVCKELMFLVSTNSHNTLKCENTSSSLSSKFDVPFTPSDQTKFKYFQFLLQRAKFMIDKVSPDTSLFYTACHYCIQQKKHDSLMFVLDQLLKAEKPLQYFPCDSSLLKQHGVNQETPLHMVLRSWTEETDHKTMPIVQLLLDRGAPLLAKDSNGMTCLELLQMCFNNHLGQALFIGKFISLKQITAARLRCVLKSANENYTCLVKDFLPQHLWEYIKIF